MVVKAFPRSDVFPLLLSQEGTVRSCCRSSCFWLFVDVDSKTNGDECVVMKRCITIFACFFLVLAAGCSGGAPKGFPKVVPCSITVLDGTTPIDDVEVTLRAETESNGMIFYGKTNASGVCKVGTSFASFYKEGVPEGNYKVMLVKEPVVEDTKTREEQNAMSRPELDAYRAQMKTKRDALPRIIPVPLTTAARTPLTVNVQGKTTALTVNVAEHK